MQNFKQFLLKEEQTSSYTFEVVFHATNSLNRREVQFLQDKVESLNEDYQFDISIDREQITCKVLKLTNISNHELTNIYDMLLEEVNAIVLQFDNDIEGGNTNLISHGLPNQKLQWETIEIICPSNFSLTGISKVIDKECIELFFSNVDNITGGILDIFKIDKSVNIYFHVNTITPKWANIAYKHLEDRDILECQEELITNGLKQYAKF
jgi:hypothetical protein